MDDGGTDTERCSPHPQVCVGRRDHGIPGTEKDHIPVLRQPKDLTGFLLDIFAIQEPDRLFVECLQFRAGGAHKP